MTRLATTLWTYWKTRRMAFESRAALERHQARRLRTFIEKRLVHSPYFSPFVGKPLHAWPIMTKSLMMEKFDTINTARLRLDDVLACALDAERSRDFSPTVGGFSVGLSSGTSGSRGVFVVSPTEQAIWAGVMLARLLPRGLFAGERVALFLRANNNLYTSVRSPWISFEFFDLLEPLDGQLARLERYAPTIVVGPAQVLGALAAYRVAGRVAIAPGKVISGAEVLDPSDRTLLAQAFGTVGEVYQATEGFLGATCAHGTLHLNEAHVHVEPHWLDAHRFVPIITDFTRYTQPIVRYRLDDILVKRASPCPCGSHEMALERIEGRSDDLLKLPGHEGQRIDLFADGLSRALAQVLPLTADYRLIQTGAMQLALYVDAPPDRLAAYREHLDMYLAHQGVATSLLEWSLHAGLPPADFSIKRRRIIRRAGAS
ncbi:F390 synthetase-related protein [Trinickia caryophylli]|uniref:Putative adenylate-forming enzyme n=1 Tax=Trinickia caryophylli TaxID=28094 RepID=A0A1X7EH97_TRICW|nr:F390 synthetase-related protein [Trinickia caryophylli]PMS11025.1 CoF synthetase [Trinickia caryophylli]TRX14482.1 CoF synthetase [Trinickia caryophylli]WQE14321.1 F390 synthetase-related protein [Trinickia caryophylli]SMF33972.1 putative adenylate-forming enzyme [Trinickia caryophylli]GLU32296.1 coenzyme F390 synthetase [Trinickia caryophylli]